MDTTCTLYTQAHHTGLPSACSAQWDVVRASQNEAHSPSEKVRQKHSACNYKLQHLHAPPVLHCSLRKARPPSHTRIWGGS